jgi:hypothetical protein
MKTKVSHEIDMFNFMIEPLTILFWGGNTPEKVKSKTTENDWVHPDIEEITSTLCTPSKFNNGYYDGPILRFTLETEDGEIASMSTFFRNPKAYQFVLDNAFKKFNDNYNEKIAQNISEAIYNWIRLCCTEDCWGSKASGQFMTQFPETYSHLCNMFDKPHKYSYSPDIGLRGGDGEDWGWCT